MDTWGLYFLVVSKRLIHATKICVLLAEDNKMKQKVMHRMLLRLGVEHIDIVENGQDAVIRRDSDGYLDASHGWPRS